MAENSRNELKQQLFMVTESILKVAKAVTLLQDRQCDDVSVPYNFLCPLSGSVMIDPVLLSNGQTYERFEIKNRLKSGVMVCPVTRETLLERRVTPNHLIRVLIRDWCKDHNKSDLIQYTLSTPLYIVQEYFETLHLKLKLSSKMKQKEAAREVRKETTKHPYFRRLYANIPNAITQLITPLSNFGGTEIDHQLEDDLIATLKIISVDEEVKKVISESINGNLVLIQALQSENMETQRNATLTIFEISTFDSSKDIIGSSDAMVILATLLTGNRRKLLYEDVVKTLLRLLENNENKVKAVKQFADAGIFNKIEDSECIDVMLPIFASLSKLEEGMNEIEKYDCRPFFCVLRESLSDQDKNYAGVILFNALRKDGSKWKRMIVQEEIANGTVTNILKTGA